MKEQSGKLFSTAVIIILIDGVCNCVFSAILLLSVDIARSSHINTSRHTTGLGKFCSYIGLYSTCRQGFKN